LTTASTPSKGIIPADFAYGHERAEAVQQVLSKHIARHIRLQPADRAHRVAISRRNARPGDLANGNLRGCVQRDNDEIPLLDGCC
jgi:hypothetical protein